jgi:crotonobetainyl-CoA:carnitine CoA-transferase CaiB-like acyl-CoA transferase
MRAGTWQKTLGVGLHGKTLGIVGLGRVGAGVARVGLAFGMKVIAWSQNLTSDKASEHGVTLATKEELFRTSDVVSVHVILSDRTRGLVGKSEIGLIKGPWRTWSAYDGLAQALSSQMFGNGEPDGQPMLVADAIVDKGAGMWAAIAILAALHDRAKTGKGSIVETSLLEAALFWRDGVFAQYVASGRSPRRPGNGSVQIVPYGVFPTADKPIMLGLAGDGGRGKEIRLGGREGLPGLRH